MTQHEKTQEQMQNFISHLECSVCQARFSDTELHTTCPKCGKVLLVRYDLAAAKQQLDKTALSGKSMWRYSPLMPVRDPKHIVSLGEGGTPLLRLRKIGEKYGIGRLYCKDESFNPTSSFKARGLCAAVSKAHELGVKALSIPTAGNAGSALAAYASASPNNMRAHVFMPRDTPQPIVKEHMIYGAQITFVDGTIADAAKKMNEMRKEPENSDWFDVSTLKEPYRLEGKKTLGYEIAEFFNWSLPDVIVYPTGGGTGLIGMWKAFEELEQLGWLPNGVKKPKMVVVQAAGCAPIVKAHKNGSEQAEFCENAQTYASGLRVPKPFADYIILSIVKESQGTAIAVEDADMEQSVKDVATTEGVYMCPEGGACVFVLQELLDRGIAHKDDTIVVFNTASGLKYQ